MTEASASSYADSMDQSARAEQAALVALLRVRPDGMSWADITADVLAAGSALEVWHRSVPATLLDVPGSPGPLAAAAQDIGVWLSQGATLVSILNDRYPSRLREIHQAPPLLFARGALRAHDPAVSLVGSRQASERGLALAAEVAHGLAARDVTVVAGLAAGIDAAAHQAALADGARTVAIIGTGIQRVYPAVNRALHQEIAARGLLLSQFWPDAPPQKQNFPMRNATMSGYGLATVVIEAGEQSGARIQARLAVEHGRPVILTELVVQRNAWARALLGRPGVHVAGSARTVLETVGRIMAERAVLGDALRRLSAV